jgi:hypothetical protein
MAYFERKCLANSSLASVRNESFHQCDEGLVHRSIEAKPMANATTAIAASTSTPNTIVPSAIQSRIGIGFLNTGVLPQAFSEMAGPSVVV